MPVRADRASGSTLLLLRAVNVGGHAVVRSTEIAEKLSRFDVASVGAAGSFIARQPPRDDVLRAAVRKAVGFDTGIMLMSESDARRLLTEGPPEWRAPPNGTRRFVTLLAGSPTREPSYPLVVPSSGSWELKVVGRLGSAVLTVRRIPAGEPQAYPNPIVEKAFGMPATTRGLDTIEALLGKST